jgi:hypothetical protein
MTIDELETGDEIEFSDGQRWACNQSYVGNIPTGIWLLPRSFPGPFDDILDCDRLLLTPSIKIILEDALKGGARIHKGAGLSPS